MLMLPSQVILPSSSFTVFTSPFSTRVISTTFLESTYNVLIYNTCFSLSDLLHPVWQTLGSSISLQMTQFHSFLCLNNILLYICIKTSYQFICWWTFRLLLCPLLWTFLKLLLNVDRSNLLRVDLVFGNIYKSLGVQSVE